MSEHDDSAQTFPLVMPRGPSGAVKLLMLVLVAIGTISFGVALAQDPPRAWRCYLISAMFFMSIALASVVWSAATRLSNGRFARPVVRIMEGLGAFIPVGYVALAVFLFLGAQHVYPWVKVPYAPHPQWLTLTNMTIRDLLSLLALVIVTLVFMRASLKPDLAALRDRAPEHLRGLYRGFSAGFDGSDIEVERNRKFLLRMSPAVAIMYAWIWSLIAMDLFMSIDPEWVSSMFPGVVFMGGFLGGIALTAIISVIVRRSLPVDRAITPVVLHDVGKLVFALSCMWAMVNWSQYLPIWYAKLPEETHWMVLRFSYPWRPWAFAVIAMVWAMPFFLMMTLAAKRNPASLTFFSLMILAGLWLERFLMVVPTLSPHAVVLGVPEIGTALGFLGVFLSCFLWYRSRFPILPVVNPYGPAAAPVGASPHLKPQGPLSAERPTV